ncbi:MAG: DUF2798 domain-containing protein [Alcaligenaceae bacterium]|jgi:hypothetical protein|nr:DUF2798 domain-containing protein [Alcaligenaceae bacterium]
MSKQKSNKRHTHFFFGLIPKLPGKTINWLMPLILSGMMSGTISGFNTVMNLGFAEDVFYKWLKAWSVSWAIAFPLILIFAPLTRRFVMLIINTQPVQTSQEKK